MCGHIHTPADKMLGNIHYLNSGDWIESLTAVVEHWDGSYQLIEYSDFLKEFPVEVEAASAEESELPVSLPATPAQDPSRAPSTVV
jgi:hypothetical protein